MRLIDADALIERVEPYKDKYGAEEFPYYMVHEAFIHEMKKEPTIDAVPVIHCKDCKHYTGKWCTKFSTKQFDINDICKADDDFCSMAERIEE